MIKKMKEKQKYISIMGSKYKIKFVKDEFDFWGRTDLNKKVITIVKDQNAQFLKETIIHELLHSYINEYGFFYEEYNNDEKLIFFISNIFLNLYESFNQVLKMSK